MARCRAGSRAPRRPAAASGAPTPPAFTKSAGDDAGADSAIVLNVDAVDKAYRAPGGFRARR